MSLSNVEIILVEPIYPGNVGAVARSAFNFGIPQIKIVGDIDLTDLEAKRMSLYGYELILHAMKFATLRDALSDAQCVIGTVHQPRHNRTSPQPVWDVFQQNANRIITDKTAIVFGREDNGLTRDEIDLCHYLAIIPSPENLSFNIAHAVTVTLCEAYHYTQDLSPDVPGRRPCQEEYEDIAALIKTMLTKVGFFRGNQEISVMTTLRDMLYRSEIRADELPMLKAILFKIVKTVERLKPDSPNFLHGS